MAIFVSLALSAGCGKTPVAGDQVDRVVLITIDTLRADHLASFGYPIDTAPFLESLARRGTSFKRAFAHSATTCPSHSSMFTSLYPIQHGVRTNGMVLDDSFVTLAEVLGSQGFSTAAFVSGNVHFKTSRVAQGFQHYDQPPRNVRNPAGKLILYRSARQTTDAAIAWLQENSTTPKLFLWVHYYDPHLPFRMPAEYVARATPASAEDRQELRDYLANEHHAATDRRTVVQIDRYDAEIMFADDQIRRLFEVATQLGVGARSLWIVTSDHGQGLSNHGLWGHHEQIYNVQLHVPLIFSFAGGAFAAGEIDDQIVEHVDIPATILDLFGLQMSGQPAPVQGRSLVPLLLGQHRYNHRTYAFAERRIPLQEKLRPREGEQYALQSLRYKYLWATTQPDELYDLSEDPYETENLINATVPGKTEMRQLLERLVATLRTDQTAQIVDEETLELLRLHGYVQ